ncbi:MAG TPA: hypothetical protein V6C65_19235, partial [Allocoleopsis sp.]
EAGTDITICATSDPVNVTEGSGATQQTGVVWTSSGTGSFTNADSLTECTYTASAEDLAAGSVTLTLTATNTGCDDVTSAKTLTFIAQPTAIAGDEMSICSTVGSVNITDGSSANNYINILWTTSGTGSIDNPDSLTSAVYTPSAEDIAAGSVILTLTAYGNTPCADAVATKTLNINSPMTAVAGADFSACSSETAINVTTDAIASNQTSVLWTSNGTGSFTEANSLTQATYMPSADDLASGSVVFTLTVSNTGCTDVTSTKTMTFVDSANAIAGMDLAICSYNTAVNVTFGASASNYSAVEWTSSGTGTFTDADSLTAATYFPSADDIAAGGVTITLTAIGNTPCSDAVSSKILTIDTNPTATAGVDFSTCYTGGSINIGSDASATHHTSVIWISNGTGTFENADSLTNCNYTPSEADLAAGSIVFSLIASNAGCGVAYATKTVTISALPTVVAGDVINTCESNGAVNITVGSNATNYNSIVWTSSGTGTFTDADSLTSAT